MKTADIYYLGTVVIITYWGTLGSCAVQRIEKNLDALRAEVRAGKVVQPLDSPAGRR